jgi:hypothetical protein
MQRGAFPEGLLELRGVHCRDRRRVERADAPPELVRAGESLLERHLLVEHEAVQQRIRIVFQQPVGLVVAGERQQRPRVLHRASIVARRDLS